MSPIVSGGSSSGGVGAVLYSIVLSGTQASVDSGAGGFSTSYNLLEIFISAQTNIGGSGGNIGVTFNNDSGANYDRDVYNVSNTSVTGSAGVASNNILLDVHGGGGSATYPSPSILTVPAYAGTTFWKGVYINSGVPDATAANMGALAGVAGWRSTSAINRVTITPTSGSFVAGTAVYIYAR